MDQTYAMVAVGGLVLLLVLVAVLVIAMNRAATSKTSEWMAKASALGLNGSGTYPLLAMSGSLDGTTVGIKHVRDKMTSSGNVQTRGWCEAYANISGGVGDLDIAEEGVRKLEDELRGEITVSEGAVRWKGGSADLERALQILRALAAAAKSFRS